MVVSLMVNMDVIFYVIFIMVSFNIHCESYAIMVNDFKYLENYIDFRLNVIITVNLISFYKHFITYAKFNKDFITLVHIIVLVLYFKNYNDF